jgi:hypothetical protein
VVAALVPREGRHRDREDRLDQCSASVTNEGRHYFVACEKDHGREGEAASQIDAVRGNCERGEAYCSGESRGCWT